MISSTGLEVQLTLNDKLTAGMNKAFESVSKNIQKASKSFESLGREISQAGKNMTFLGVSITGPMAIAFKTASDYSIEAGDSLKSLTASAIEFQAVIGNAMVPVINKLTNAINSANQWLQQMDPAMRNAVIQGALMVGIFLTLGGAIMNVVGKLATMIARVVQFAAANAPLLIMAGTLIAIIYYWDQLRTVAMPVIAGLQIGADMVAIGFLKMLDAIMWVAEQFTNMALKLKPMIDALEHFHLISSQTAEGWRAALDGMSMSVGSARDEIHESIAALEMDMQNAMSGQGWAESADTGIQQIKTKFQELVNFFQMDFVPPVNTAMQQFSQNFASTFKQAYDQATNLGKNTANIVVQQVQMFSQQFGQGFAQMIVHGKNFGDSMKQMFIDMATAFIAAVVQMIAQWMAFVALKAATSWMGFGLFHEGGKVMHSGGPVRAHNGLAVDEVPIIAQTGEGILSRRGMAALGGEGALNALNSGQPGGGGISVNIGGNVYAQNTDQINDLAERIAVLVNEKNRSRMG